MSNRPQYIIDIIANDSKLREQMSKWDWEKLIGKQGKGLGDALGDNAKYGIDAIERKFKGLDIDWSQVLNTKQLEQLEQSVTRILAGKRDAIADMLKSGDTTQLKDAIDGVVKLGQALSSLGSNFDAASLSRGMTAFMKVIAPLKAETKEIEDAFSGLFTRISRRAQNTNIDGAFEMSGTIRAAMKELGAADEEVEKASKNLEHYRQLVKNLKGRVRIDPALQNDLEGLTTRLNELIAKEKELAEAGKTSTGAYATTVKKIMAYEDARLKAGGKPRVDVRGEYLRDEFGYYEEMIDRVVNKLSAKITELEEKMRNVANESFAKTISEQISNIQVKLSLDERSKASFKQELNAFVNNISNSDVATAKVKVDWAFNPTESLDGTASGNVGNIENIKKAIESEIVELNDSLKELEKKQAEYQDMIDQSEYAGKKNPWAEGQVNKIKARVAEVKELIRTNQHLLDTSDDPATRQALTSTLKSFQAIQKVLDSKQGALLTKTYEWRNKMIEAMKMEKADVNIQLGFDKGLEASADNLYNYLQAYFEENQLELHLNKDAFIQEIKDAVEKGGVSVGSIGGGGTVNLNPESLKSAIAEGLLAALTGEYTPLGAGTATTQPAATQSEKKRRTVYLDPNSPYMQHMVEAVRAFAEYATKDTRPGVQIRDFFGRKTIGLDENGKPKSIQIDQYANASPMDIADMLSQLIEKYGVTLLDDFDNLIKDVGQNRVVKNFRGDLSELLYSQNVGQRTISDDDRRRESIKVFDDLVHKSRLLEAFNVKNPKWKVPEVADLNEIFNMATASMNKDSSEYQNAFESLSALQTIMANEDGMEGEAQKERLIAAVNAFKDSIRETYDTLFNYVSAYDMDVFVKGSKKPYHVSGRTSALRAQNAIGDDNSKIEDVRIYKDTSTGVLGVTGRNQERKMIRGYDAKSGLIVKQPDRTDILNRDTSINDWRTYEIVQADIEKTKKEAAEAFAAGNQLLAIAKQMKLVNLEKELETFVASARWEDESASKRADSRSNDAESKLKYAAYKQSRLENEQNITQAALDLLNEQKATIDAQIEHNDAEIAKLNDDPRKLAGARTRLANRKAALAEAKKERDLARDNADAFDSIDTSERDAKVANVTKQLRKYKAWQKHPDKYYDDIVEEMYSGQRDSAVLHRDTAKRNVLEVQAKIDTTDKDIAKYQSWIDKYGPNKDTEEKIQNALKARAEYVRQLEEYQKEQEKYDEKIKQIYAKIAGATDEDKAAFNADFERFINGGYDEEGKPIGKLQYWQREKANLGPDLRSEAEQRLKKADKAYQKAQQEYDEVANSDEAKRAVEIDRLERENEELRKRLEDEKILKNIKDTEQKLEQHKKDREIDTASKKLTVVPHKAEVDELLHQTEQLDDKIQESKREAEALDKFVQETISGENYKKTEYDIKHTEKDQAKIDRHSAYKNRADYLTKLADDQLTDEDKVPENITAAMSKAIEALTKNREIVKMLSQDFGLDKFETDDALRKEISARLARSTDGKNPLPQIVQEFYNKILSDGKDVALKWAKETLDTATSGKEYGADEIRKFAQQDKTDMDKLAPEVQNAQEHLKETFKTQVRTWSDSIREKIALRDSGKLTSQELALVAKEIDELFALLHKALGDYTSQFRGGEYQYQKNRLINEFKNNKISEEDYRKQMNALETETSRRLRGELFGDNESLFDSSREFGYSDYLNRDVEKYIAEQAAVRKDIDDKLKEREPILKLRQAELLRDIASSRDAEEVGQLEEELRGVNEELARYAQYNQQMSDGKVLSFFQDDVQFLAEYKTELAKIIRMEQQVDLDRAKGASQEELDRQYDAIDSARIALNEKMRLGLQSKQEDVLPYMESLYAKRDRLESQHTSISSAIVQAIEAGKPTEALEKQLADVANQIKETNDAIRQMTVFELNKRRQTDTQLDGIAYKADENVMSVYNDQTQKMIEAEQKLAIARANGEGVEDALSAKRTQGRKRRNAIERAQEARQAWADENSPRVRALKYLTDTEDAYTTALEKRATLDRRIRAKEAQIDDIENDQKYSTSWQYKRHQRTIKDRLVNEYVGSDQYHADRDAGMANVKSEMLTYLGQTLSEDAAQNVWYQLERTLDKRGERIEGESLQDTFDRLLEDNADYQKFNKDRATEYQRILDAPTGSIDTGVTDLNLAIDAMHISRDALAEGRERIEREKQANIDFINSVSENDYEPLKQEMQKVAARVNLKSMVSGFKDVIAQNRSREATINNLKNQVLQAGGNQTEANHLAEQLDNIGDSALKDVDAWAKRFLPEIFWTTEEQFRYQARQNLIANETAYADRETSELQHAYDQSERQVKSIFGRETNKMTDVYVSKYLGGVLDGLAEDSGFRESAGGQFNEILTTFQTLLEEKVFNLVSNYAESLSVKDGMLGGINIRDEVRKLLLRELDILQGRQPSIDADIAHIEGQRRAAMKYGGVSTNEVADADVLKQQATLMSRLTQEKETQKELTERIAYLEQTEASEQEIGRLNKALAATNKSIDRLQLLAGNTDTLLELQHQVQQDEAAAKQWTPEQQKLWFMNKLELARANLDSEDVAVRTQAEQQVARYTELLSNLEAKMSAEEAERRKDASLIGVMTKALKDAFGGKGGFALDATGIASETTLQKIAESIMRILVALGGDKLTRVNKDPDMEAKLARIRELEAKRVVVSGQTSSGDTKSSRDILPRVEEPDYITKAREYGATLKNSVDPIADIRNAIVELGKETKGTEGYLIAQLKLQKAINNFTSKNKDAELAGVEWSTYKSGKNKGKQYHTNDAMLSYLATQDGISKEALDLRLSEKKAKEIAANGFTAKVEPKMEPAAVANEAKKNTAETPATVVVTPVLDSNKQEIATGTNVNDLKPGQKDAYSKYIGKAVGSYKVSDAIFADENALKAKVAELQGVMAASAKDSEEYLKAMVEMSRLISTWRNVVKKTKPDMSDNAEWQKYLTSGEGKLFDKTEDVPLGGITSSSKVTLKQTAMGLGTKISEEAKNALFVAQQVTEETKEEVKPAQQKAEAKEREVVAEEKITEEKKEQKAVEGGLTKDEQDELARLKKETKDYDPKATLVDDAEWNGFASENTLLAILELVKKIATEGVKKSGTKSSEKKNKTEADFIRSNTLKQDELTRSLIAGKGSLYTQYVGYVDELNQAVAEANKAKDGDKEAALEKVRNAAKKIDEFNNSIVENLDVQSEFKKKTLDLKNKFDDAQKVGYIDANDKDLQAFNALFTQIQESNAPDKLEEMRIQTIALGDAIQKTINKNKGLMVGNGAKKQLDNQYNKIMGTQQVGGYEFGARFVSDSFLAKSYIGAYTELNNKYQQYADSHKLNDPQIQQQLQQEAVKVQALGQRYLSSIQQAEDLQRLVEQSGTRKDKKTGDDIGLGGTTSVTADEVQNLKQTMLSFVQDGLKQGIIEGTKFDSVNQRMTYTFRTSKNTVAEMVVQYNDATNALYAYRKQEHESLSGFAGWMQSMKGKMRSILQYTTSITSITRIWGEVKRGIQYVRDIDSALTELKKVTEETEETYNRFLKTAAKTADKVGSTIKEVVSSTADWARLGYSLKDATTLAETTSVLLNVSEFQSIDEATSALTSTLQAFSMTAATSMGAVDVLNEIGNNFAISSDGIATALQDSASSLVAANNSYEQAVALIASANRVVQDPNSVGAALRTISLRLRGTSTKELAEAGEETDGAVTSKSKLRSKVKALSGVDILTDTGAYKSTYDILLEISKVWKEMSDIDQAALLEILAGKTRSNTAAAILSNTKDLEAAYKSAMDAEGSALEENKKYLDSIQGRIDLFNNSVQTMWQNTINSDIVKLIVDAGTGLVKIVDKLGAINTLVMGLMTYWTVFKKKGKLDLASILGIHDVEDGWTFGKAGVSGWVKNKAQKAYGKYRESHPKKTSEIVNDFIEQEKAEPIFEQIGMFDEDQLVQQVINTKQQQLNQAKAELKQLNRTKWKDVVIPDDQTKYKYNNARMGYLREVLIPNKEAEIKAIEADIEEMSNAAQAKIEKEKTEIVQVAKQHDTKYRATDGGQIGIDFDAMDGDDTPAKTSKYLGVFENGLQAKRGGKPLSVDYKKLGAELDKVGKMSNEDLVAYMESLDDLGEEAGDTSLALAGYASTVKDGNYSIQGARQYVNNYNKSLQGMSKSAMKAQLVQVGLNLAISAATMLLTSLITKAIEAAVSAQNEFEELSTKLSSTTSDMENIVSALDDVKDKIKELEEQGSLSFADKEELERLKKQGEELERQRDLVETIKKQQQQRMNDTAVEAASNYYKKTGKNSGKTTKELAGSGAQIGLAIGGVVAGALISVLTAGLGTGAGIAVAAAGVAAAGAVGAGIGAIYGAAEEKVGEAVDSMQEKYAELQQNYADAQAKYQSKSDDKNYEKMQKAQEQLTEYESEMANYLSEMDKYYSQIDLNAETDPDRIRKLRAEINDFYDTQDKWAIASGGQDAKYNAITRIFGENADENLKNIKRDIKEAAESGRDINMSDYFNSADLEEFKARLYEMGIYVYEVEAYFEDLAKTEEEAAEKASLYDVVTDINKITEGLDSLKNAFNEVAESGSVAASTLVSLNDTFGTLGDTWDNYVNTMYSGVASTKEMTRATEELAKAFIDSKILTGEEITATERLTYIIQLENLGVENAEEYVDDKIAENAYKAIQNSATYNEDAVRAAWNSASEEDKKKFKDDFGLDYINFADLTSDDIAKVAEYYGEAKEINADTAKKILQDYGVEGDKLAEATSLLQQKIDKEKELKDLKNKQDQYDEYQAELKKIQEVTDHRQMLIDKYGHEDSWAMDGDVEEWNTAEEAYKYITVNNKYKNINKDEFVRDYNTWKNLIAQNGGYAKLLIKKKELEEKLGELNLNPETNKDEIDKLQAEIDGIDEKIETEITADIQLRLDLQNKSDLVDQIQNVFDTLVNAQKEYDETGHISVDTLQSLLQLEPKYLDLLVDEKGNLNLTKDALYNVARARIVDMGIQSQKNIIEKASALASEGSSDAIREQIEVMSNATDEGSDFVEMEMAKVRAILSEKVALGELSQAEADAFIEGTMNQIEAVQVATQSALDNLNNSLSSSGNTATTEAEDEFQKLMDHYDNRISASQAKHDQIQNDIDYLEAQGKMADASYYRDQIALLTEGEESQEALLEAKLQGAADRLKELEDAGKKGSDEWWAAANIYNSTLSELDDIRNTVLSLQDSIGNLKWAAFDEFNSRLDDITSKLQTIRTLLAPNGSEDWFDDEGNWTEKGVAVLGSEIQELNTSKADLNEANTSLSEFGIVRNDDGTWSERGYDDHKEFYANVYGIHSEQEYYDARQKLLDEQYNAAVAVNDKEQDIADMYESQIDAVEEYYQTLVDGYNDYIDSAKEALDAERELYKFKQNVQKQTKDIASVERRIAALSGSTNASDIAERRKLEAQLAEQREELNDTYYEHSAESQQEALDAEAHAYEEAMNSFVEGLRNNLSLALEDMDGFIAGVTAAVTANAPIILDAYNNLGVALDSSIVDPWNDAIDAMGPSGYSGENGLGLMNSWVADGGVFDTFATNATNYLTSIWADTNVDPNNSFSNAVTNVVSGIKDSIKQNVDTAKGYLNDLYNIKTTSETGTGDTGNDGRNDNPSQKKLSKETRVDMLPLYLDQAGNVYYKVQGMSNAYVGKYATVNKSGILYATKGTPYYTLTEKNLKKKVNSTNVTKKSGSSKFQAVSNYAKGTLGTTKDELAITDESWIGDEITLAAGKNGQLQYLKKGSAVMPADISANLIEWGKLNPSMLTARASTNVSMISNAISKPEFNITFDSLIKAENITEETLPAVKKLVTQELNRFTKELNYALKGKGAR